MKKSCIIILSLLLISLVAAQNSITGETITGKASSQQTEVSLRILPVPRLTIYTPKNGTYLVPTTLIQYSATYADAFYYGFSYPPTTSASNGSQTIYINPGEGQHILYLFGNNSREGYELNSSLNQSFTINTSLFDVIYNEFNGSNKGDSTNFISYDYTYEELQNLSSIILENELYGKILFLEEINLTNDSDPNDLLINLDENIHITLHRIEINSTAIPNLNKEATIWIYNIPYVNPQILKDGSLCSSAVCTQESFLGGILKFNVTGFSTYSTRETPIYITIGGGGGGGSSSTTIIREETISIEYLSKENITTDPNKIVVDAILNTETIIPLIIENQESKATNISLQIKGLKNRLFLSETYFELGPNSKKTIDLTLKAGSEIKLYNGDLIIKTDNQEKLIPVILNVKSRTEVETPFSDNATNEIQKLVSNPIFIISIILIGFFITISIIINRKKTRE